jgi:hypothetical protein
METVDMGGVQVAWRLRRSGGCGTFVVFLAMRGLTLSNC